MINSEKASRQRRRRIGFWALLLNPGILKAILKVALALWRIYCLIANLFG